MYLEWFGITLWTHTYITYKGRLKKNIIFSDIAQKKIKVATSSHRLLFVRSPFAFSLYAGADRLRPIWTMSLNMTRFFKASLSSITHYFNSIEQQHFLRDIFYCDHLWYSYHHKQREPFNTYVVTQIPYEVCEVVPDIECVNVLKKVPELQCTPEIFEDCNDVEKRVPYLVPEEDCVEVTFDECQEVISWLV